MAQTKLTYREQRTLEIDAQIQLLKETIDSLVEEYEYLSRPGFYVPKEGFKKPNLKNYKKSNKKT